MHLDTKQILGDCRP